LSAAELHGFIAERIAGARAAVGEIERVAGAPRSARAAHETVLGELAAAVGRLERYEGLADGERSALASDAGRLDRQARRLAGQFARSRDVWNARRAALDEARRAAAATSPGEKAAAHRSGEKLLLVNDMVAVALEDAAASVCWLGATDAAVRGIRCGVEAGGETTTPAAVEARTERFSDGVGSGMECRQTWGDRIRNERVVRVYDGAPVVTFGGSITNAGDAAVSLGTARLVDVGEGGWWQAGEVFDAPAAVYVGGTSEFLCEPAVSWAAGGTGDRSFAATQVLAFAERNRPACLVAGYLTGLEARPDLSAAWRWGEGGTALRAELRFLGRVLPPGASIRFDTVYLAAGLDPFAALERYGDAVAKASALPVRRGANSLWCSWYAHRMAMTEDLVLANAAVAARHFKPLGMQVIQLDHGWQRGDITGDWVPNERFPHGLAWLARELKSRHGMELGVWISPTDVAETSECFKEHRAWMLTDDRGEPRVNWRWYWKPNPDCYEIDASQPAAVQWIEDTFAQLTSWGVRYYKIDFIASAGSEAFRQHDPAATRGWSVLRRAMEAVRRGAGPDAWIRYCQTPPLLSVGLADSAYGGSDTLDAGLGGNIDVLRTNARSLAASFWVNDRLYHREVCDMSVRMQAEVEEARLRLAIMTLAGTSISFSDELQHLPPSRIRMMQACLPPGGPPFRPLDLLDRSIPSIWHLRCDGAAETWDVVGLFNFEREAEERSIAFEALGIPADAEVLVFEFWEQRFLGTHRGSLTVSLPGQTSRILSLRRLAGVPQIVGTDMHLLQGFHEIKQAAWDEKTATLAGEYERMPSIEGRTFMYVPDAWRPVFEFPLSPRSARLTHVAGPLWMHEVRFDGSRVAWSLPFEGAGR
jgi:hypothetical protein